MKGNKRCSLIVFVMALAFLSSTAFAVVRYQVIDLDTLYSWRFGGLIPTAINDSGQICGTSSVSSENFDAFLWDNGQLLDLRTLGGETSAANDINSSGVVVGNSPVTENSPHNQHAFFWRSGRMHDLGVIDGGTRSQATGISDSGLIVGWGDVSTDKDSHLFTSDGRDALVDHGAPKPGDTASLMTAKVNGAGVVVGSAATSGGRAFGWLWTLSSGFSLPSIEGAEDFTFSDINESGTIAGTAKLSSDDAWHPFVVGSMTGFTYLKTLGGRISEAKAINGAGHVVGSSDDASGVKHATLWASGKVIDLNTVVVPGSGFEFTAANDINSNGWIVAEGRKEGFAKTRGALLKPLPGSRPTNVTLSPNSGVLRLGTNYTFSARYSDPDGYGDIRYCYLLINVDGSLTNGIYVLYDASKNKMYVRDDSNTRWTGGIYPGKRTSIENSACKLYGEQSSVSSDGNSLTVKWTIRPKSILYGKSINAWMFVRDFEDLRDGFDRMGGFTVL